MQARFVDEPVLATSEAHVLVRRVLSERGYPTQDLDSQTDLVSVDHPEVVGDYREAVRRTRAGEKGEATTEDLREAMVHYRSLFSRLLATATAPTATPGQGPPAPPGTRTAARSRTAPAAAPAVRLDPTPLTRPSADLPVLRGKAQGEPGQRRRRLSTPDVRATTSRQAPSMCTATSASGRPVKYCV